MRSHDPPTRRPEQSTRAGRALDTAPLDSHSVPLGRVSTVWAGVPSERRDSKSSARGMPRAGRFALTRAASQDHTRYMKNIVAFFLVLAGLVACGGRTPPAALLVDASMPAAIRTAVADAAEHWCEASAGRWCPDVLEERETDLAATLSIVPVVWDFDYSRHGRAPHSMGFYQAETDTIYLDARREHTPATWSNIILHEVGHCGVVGHLDDPGGLLSAVARAEAPIICIDQQSANLLCDQQGWTGCQSTCEAP